MINIMDIGLFKARKPMHLGIILLVHIPVNVILNLILMGPLKHGGLALATSISAIFNLILLIHFIYFLI